MHRKCRRRLQRRGRMASPAGSGGSGAAAWGITLWYAGGGSEARPRYGIGGKPPDSNIALIAAVTTAAGTSISQNAMLYIALGLAALLGVLVFLRKTK